MQDNEIDAIVEQLDQSGEPWMLSRAEDGTWWLQRGSRETERTLTSASLSEVLRQALDSKALPVIPREPKLHHYTCVQDGCRWWVQNGSYAVTPLPTRKKAEELIAKLQAHQAKILEDWNAKYLVQVLHGTPGVDFRWAD